MPVTAILNLRALSNGRVPRSFHCLMHPVFLNRISKANPSLGRRLHDFGAMIPYSLSPMMGIRNKVVVNESYWVRIGLLHDELAEVFLYSLEKNLWSEAIHLENHIFIPENILFGKIENNIWTGCESYDEITEASSGSERITLQIESPLAFKKGDLHYPLPEPAMVMGNLIRRWNMFATSSMPLKIGFDNISFSYMNIRTRPYGLRKGGTIVGTTGKVTFIMKGSVEERRRFESLLRFAFYAGIGVKTAQGMGMCRMR